MMLVLVLVLLILVLYSYIRIPRTMAADTRLTVRSKGSLVLVLYAVYLCMGPRLTRASSLCMGPRLRTLGLQIGYEYTYWIVPLDF